MRNLRGDVLAFLAIMLLGAAVWGLFYVRFPADSKELLIFLMGVLAGIVKDVYSFEFGASKSGERNAKVVADTMQSSAAAMTAPSATTGTPIKVENLNADVAGDATVTERK